MSDKLDNKTEALIKINEFIEDIEDESDENYDQIIKHMPSLIRNDRASHISTKEYPDNTASIHKVIVKFLCDKDKEMKKFLESRVSEESVYYNDIPEIVELRDYIIKSGTYVTTIKHNKKKSYIILVVKEIIADDDSYTSTDLYILGKHHKDIHKGIKKLQKYYDDLVHDRSATYIKTYANGGSESTYKETPFKSFDNMIMKDKDKLIKYIDRWVESIPMWYKYNMTPKLSILVYGAPGTGKSTLCRAVARHLHISTVGIINADYFDTPDNNMKRAPIRRATQYLDEVLALDDLDCFVNSRDTDNSPENGRMMNKILEFLDNPPTFYYKAKDGTKYLVSVVIATTNYYDKLDPAIKRAGRFDLQFEMGLINWDETEEFCKYYELDINKVFPDVRDKKSFKISPAEVQAKCLANVELNIKKGMEE